MKLWCHSAGGRENKLCYMPKSPTELGNFSYDSVNLSAGCKVLLLAILGNFCNSVLLLPPPQEKSLDGQTDVIK